MPMTPDAFFLRSRVLLAAQHALVGQITPEVRAIGVEWSRDLVHMFVYVDGLVDPNLAREFCEEVAPAIAGDFAPEPPDVRIDFVPTEPPEPVAWRGWLVYGRKEPRPSGAVERY